MGQSADYGNRPVVVTVVAMRVVQVVLDEVVDVIAVRDGLVAAAGTVLVRGIVAGALVIGGAHVGMLGVHRDRVLVDVILVGMVQVTVVQVVGVVGVPDRGVAAARAVFMRVIFMGWMRHIFMVARRRMRCQILRNGTSSRI